MMQLSLKINKVINYQLFKPRLILMFYHTRNYFINLSHWASLLPACKPHKYEIHKYVRCLPYELDVQGNIPPNSMPLDDFLKNRFLKAKKKNLQNILFLIILIFLNGKKNHFRKTSSWWLIVSVCENSFHSKTVFS